MGHAAALEGFAAAYAQLAPPGARRFGMAIWNDPRREAATQAIVFEHPGEDTVPTSVFVCDTGGMVVICAGTTGYNATVDLRYLWMRQKRLQGSHFANDAQSYAFNDLVRAGKVDPCLSRAFTYEELPLSHQLMHDNQHPHGNMAVLVGAPDFNMGKSADAPEEHHVAIVPVTGVPEQDRGDVVPMRPTGDYAAGELSGDFEELEAIVIDETTTVAEVMTKSIIACQPHDPLRIAAELMLEHKIKAVTVLERGLAIGVISQTDIILARQQWPRGDAMRMPVRQVMTLGAVACRPDDLLSTAISEMTTRRIHRLVVVTERNGRDEPIGMLSTTDIVRNMLEAKA